MNTNICSRRLLAGQPRRTTPRSLVQKESTVRHNMARNWLNGLDHTIWPRGRLQGIQLAYLAQRSPGNDVMTVMSSDDYRVTACSDRRNGRATARCVINAVPRFSQGRLPIKSCRQQCRGTSIVVCEDLRLPMYPESRPWQDLEAKVTRRRQGRMGASKLLTQ